MERRPSSQAPQPTRPQTATATPRIVGEFEVHERGIALRMRIERWPSPSELAEDEVLVEAGYGHGV